MLGVYKYVIENNIDPRMTAVRDLDFRSVLNVLKIDTAVEIGTYHGTTAAYIAQFANCVHTFDIKSYNHLHVAEKVGIENKIIYYIVKDKDEIKQILKGIKFDFAFIDDGHKYEEVKADFELVKHCGRILFHDVRHPLLPGVSKFADEIGVRKLGNNGYWSSEW